MKRAWIYAFVAALVLILFLSISSKKEGFVVPQTRGVNPGGSDTPLMQKIRVKNPNLPGLMAQEKAFGLTNPSNANNAFYKRDLTQEGWQNDVIFGTLYEFRLYMFDKGIKGDNVTVKPSDITGYFADPQYSNTRFKYAKEFPKTTKAILDALVTITGEEEAQRAAAAAAKAAADAAAKAASDAAAAKAAADAAAAKAAANKWISFDIPATKFVNPGGNDTDLTNAILKLKGGILGVELRIASSNAALRDPLNPTGKQITTEAQQKDFIVRLLSPVRAYLYDLGKRGSIEVKESDLAGFYTSTYKSFILKYETPARDIIGSLPLITLKPIVVTATPKAPPTAPGAANSQPDVKAIGDEALALQNKILNTKPAGPERDALKASLTRHSKNIFLQVTGKLPTGDWPASPEAGFLGLPYNTSLTDLNTAANQAGGWTFVRQGLERGVGPPVIPVNVDEEKRTRSTRMADFKTRISAAVTKYPNWPLPMTTPDELKYLELTRKIALSFAATDPQGPAAKPPVSSVPSPAGKSVLGPLGSSQPATLSSQKVKGVPGNDVWGPPYVGMNTTGGDGLGKSPMGVYPYLFGPHREPPPKRLPPPPPPPPPGPPDNTVPTSGMLGINSCSRVPGDKDMIPDPYAFSASNGSSKTEPVPFLTNFSAFAK